MAVLVIAEHDNASLKQDTAKVVVAAKAIGGDIHLLVAGQDCKAAADAAAKLEASVKYCWPITLPMVLILPTILVNSSCL